MSSPEFIVHIGIQKTGTKALQSFVRQNPKLMAQLGILHLQAGRNESSALHIKLYQALISDQADDMLERLVAEAQASNMPMALITYEGLSLLPDAAIEKLRQYLGPRTKIILAMRRQDDWLNSWYNQLIKAHRVQLGRIEAFEASLFAYNEECDYARTVQRWAQYFGTNALKPIIYDSKESILPKFFDSLGICTPPFVPLPPGKNPNPALTLQGMKVLREIKRIVNTDSRLPDLVDAFHRQRRDCFVDTHAHGSINTLPHDKSSAFFSMYADSNEWVRANFFPGQAHLFSSEKPAIPPALMTDESAIHQEALLFLEQQGWTQERPQSNG